MNRTIARRREKRLQGRALTHRRNAGAGRPGTAFDAHAVSAGLDSGTRPPGFALESWENEGGR